MVKSGRGRLTLVTALTVASLLLGTSAINVLAEGRGGGNGDGHGNGQGNAAHAQQVGRHDGQGPSTDTHGPAQIAPEAQHQLPAGNNGHGNDNDNHAVTSAAASGSNGQGHENKRDDDSTATATPTPTTTVSSDEAASSNDDLERDDANENDLVTPPGRVTEEMRPGLGCGDADDHSGPPGNPGKKCKNPHDNDGDASAATTADTSGDDMAATDDADTSVASDDASGD